MPPQQDRDEHPACWPLEQLESQCRLRFVRRSGPGGQHRNKVSTGVVVEFAQRGVLAEATERRSQRQNRVVALDRLRRRLAIEVRGASGQGAAPSDRWLSRLQSGRIVVGSGHFDFAALLAEALDTLAACDWDPRSAARRLRCSTTQLVRFLARETAALEHVNGQRRQRGLTPLRPRV
jgi:hypothetical protein